MIHYKKKERDIKTSLIDIFDINIKSHDPLWVKELLVFPILLKMSKSTFRYSKTAVLEMDCTLSVHCWMVIVTEEVGGKKNSIEPKMEIYVSQEVVD